MKRVAFSCLSLLLLALAGGPARATPALETPTLRNIVQINEDGFGTSDNKYAFSMAVHQGSLYVGTLNVRSMGGMASFFAGTRAPALSHGAEIWRYETDGTWTQMVKGGLGNAHNIGVRKLVAIGECIYGVTANHVTGMEVWRSCDGWNWSVVSSGGFGDLTNTSGRGLGFFQDYIYVGTENRVKGAQLWRSEDGEIWERVAQGGINNRRNIWLSDLVEFQGHLYMGTLNLAGAELFRTPDGIHFQRLWSRGLTRKSNWGAMKLYVFKDRLFVGTMNFVRGFDLFASSDGENFSAVLTHGNGDRHNAYDWQLQEFNGRLYLGTYNHSDFRMPTGRFALYSSPDGQTWTPETTDAFGNAWHYGVRTLSVLDNHLIIGSASAHLGCRVFAASPKP